MTVIKPYPKLRVIKPFGNYPRGFILTEVTALYRAYLLERGWVELVTPNPAEKALVGGLDAKLTTVAGDTVGTPMQAKPDMPNYSKRNKR